MIGYVDPLYLAKLDLIRAADLGVVNVEAWRELIASYEADGRECGAADLRRRFATYCDLYDLCPVDGLPILAEQEALC